MRIISIDPGYERLGIAIIDKEQGRKETLVFSETFKTSAKTPFVQRLQELGSRVETVIVEYGPTEMAIEKLFFTNNQKTAMNVSEARGALLYIALKHGLMVAEYTPLEIKTAVTGYGRADKNQVIMMTEKLIDMGEQKEKKHDDEYDAIACGLTHFAVGNVVK